MGIGVDFGASTVKVVELQRGLRRPKLGGMARKRVGHLQPGELRHVLPGLLKDATRGRMAGKRGVNIGVTGREINLQVAVYPASNLTHFPSMVQAEIEERKGDREDLYSGHAVLRTPDPYFPSYLAAIGMGEKPWIDERMAVIREAGASVGDVIPTPFALYAAYRRAYAPEGGVTLLVNVGSENTDIALVQGGRLIFVRNVSQGAGLMDEQLASMGGTTRETAEDLRIRYGTLIPQPEGDPTDVALSRRKSIQTALRQGAYQLVTMIQSTLNYAKTQLGEEDLSVDRVYLSGGGAKLEGLGEYLQSALKAPVGMLDPFQGINVQAIPEGRSEELLSLPTDFAVAIGLAHLATSAGEEPVLTLLPEGVLRRRRLRKTLPYLAASWLAAFATMGWMTIDLSGRRNQERAEADAWQGRLKKMKEDLARLEKAESEYRHLYAKVDHLSSHLSSSRALMELYGKLRYLHREGVFIRRIELTEPVEIRKAIVNVAEKGHLTGKVTLEDPEKGMKLAEHGDVAPLADTEPRPVERWTRLTYGWKIQGEISEDIKGDPHAILLEMKEGLNDEATRTRCEKIWQEPSLRREGWRDFDLSGTTE